MKPRIVVATIPPTADEERKPPASRPASLAAAVCCLGGAQPHAEIWHHPDAPCPICHARRARRLEVLRDAPARAAPAVPRLWYKGRAQNLPAWCAELRLGEARTRWRIKQGWTTMEAFETPLGERPDRLPSQQAGKLGLTP